MIVTYKKNSEINKELWDKTISNAPNARIYALAWYLDAMCENWSAIVSADYNFIMPLPIRKKWGINYIFQPAFTQQLGIFSSKEITTEIADIFIEKIKQHFKYGEINFNAANHLTNTNNFEVRKNYLLPLKDTYENLKKSFSRSAIRNINKAIQHHIQIEESKDCSILIQLHLERYGYQFATKKEFVALKNLLNKASEKQMAYFFYAKNTNGKFIASSGYLQFKDRVIFLINGNIAEALETGATHLLKNYAIEKFANKNIVMDFEGSDTTAFARFYEQYGAKDLDNYPFLKFNNLPTIIKLLKK